MLIFISGQILAGKFLTLSENGYFLAELLLKSVAFCDSELRRNQLNGTWCYFNPSLHNLAVSADFISLSGIPYCPVFPNIYPITFHNMTLTRLINTSCSEKSINKT